MIGKYNRSVILTYIGAAVSIAGMYCAINGYMKYAFLCLICASICDLFDGVIARRCQRNEVEKAFGAQIDSLVDVVSFLAFPAVILIALLDAAWIPAWIVAVLYVIAGIIRLAWFNVQESGSEERRTYFEGVPVTYIGLVLPVYAVLNMCFPKVFFIWGFAAIYLIMAVLFILPVRIPKPHGFAYAFFGILAVAVAGILLFLGE